MELTLAPNPLHDQTQTLTIDKVATLIGENGSGKSSILQSVFEDRIKAGRARDYRVVCFSSGQNESFSKAFSSYLKKLKRADDAEQVYAYFYDKSWSKILIFLASTLMKTGKVRDFLLEKGYTAESEDGYKDDIHSTLSIQFRIQSAYVTQIQQALKREEKGETDTFRQTVFHRNLANFIEECIDEEYEFEETIRSRTVRLQSGQITRIHFLSNLFDDPTREEPIPDVYRELPAVDFFTQAARTDDFIPRSKIGLTFKEGLDLDDLSDGEYQLLFLYALIDLFDAENALFLLDEADSHLHYKNVEKLWSLLHSIQGHAITTTHLLDSISAKENRIEHLKVVENGRINEDNKIKRLISRLSVLSRAKSVEFEVCGKLPSIALLDDYNDWIIFTKLAERAGLDVERLSDVHAMKKSSSYASASETFGKGKIDWLHGLSKIESSLVTTKVFLICDRDEAALEWNANDGVQINGRSYRKLLAAVQWPRGSSVTPYLLAWKRREIKNYLLSYTALAHYGAVEQINNPELVRAPYYLQENERGDNEDIGRLNAKPVIDPLINSDEAGLDYEKLQTYVDLIPPQEISEDITNMYNFITGKL
ncbi:ATP-binding protein [Pseudidiomarina aestuarii]|uniref:ATP-binding protein n=1 Tax=Pseudidiomarina aestuarii TaxID=624146 RepID=A0A7Z6ZSB6_9GAMM|nr:AAA family ATPase [Pseudidiomarina aestuarii]RUO39425.1 ATP-binding protein [Pseudidiomarina aestuarii]